ncbi:MAG TPA: metallophosphoesterase [Candidatus Baltobacteraceae bacterium]|nr:metallophosphoesterase [Candidatus Baltobacteraceae bacterium]
MILGVVSDTHLPRFGRALPSALVRGLTKAGVEAIVHCGDLVEQLAIDLLEEIAPVFAVAGNNDGKALHQLLGERGIIETCGRRIGVVHGHAGHGRTTADRAFNTFAGDRVDLILFGHSHIPYRERREGIVLFNPGSPTDKRFNPLYSYGIVRIAEGGIRVSHRFYLNRKL